MMKAIMARTAVAVAFAVLCSGEAFAKGPHLMRRDTPKEDRERVCKEDAEIIAASPSKRPMEANEVNSSPFGIGLLPPIQYPCEEENVSVASFALLIGQDRNVRFLDVALMGNKVYNRMEGLEFSILFNNIGRSDFGIQLTGLANYAEYEYTGAQIAAVLNLTRGELHGVQLAAINVAGEVNGVQAGVFNKAATANGLQIGVINRAEELHGVQIGLLNFVDTGAIPFMPIVNARF